MRMNSTKCRRKSSLPVFAMALAFCCAWQLHAEEPAASAAMPVAAELFTDQPKGLSDHIVAWKLIYVSEVLGNPVGGEKQGAVYEGYVKFGIGVNLDRALGWEGASLYANVLYPHGASLTQNFVRDFNVVSNIDGYDSVRLYKLWFQKTFDDFRFSFRIGQMAADKEFFTSDTAGVFLNNAFGTPSVFSQNITGPIYPVSAPGVRLRWEPSPAFSLRAAVFSGDVGSATANQHQTRIRLPKEGGALVLVEAAYKTHQAKGDDGLPGTFKLGGYYDSKWFDDNGGDGRRSRRLRRLLRRGPADLSRAKLRRYAARSQHLLAPRPRSARSQPRGHRVSGRPELRWPSAQPPQRHYRPRLRLHAHQP